MTRYAYQFSTFYILMAVAFMTSVMMFWLVSLEELRAGGGGGPREGRSPYSRTRNTLAFYGPKAGMTGLLLGSLVWVYLHANEKRLRDPTYTGADDNTMWAG
jgi:hypothetical protein